jgi:cytochrome c-type biogenesis protein CcmH
MKNMNISHLVFFILLLATAILPTSAVSAQQPTPSDDQVNAIARQLYCPVCENTPLDVCPTTACHQWRELIRKMLSEGKTDAEIKQYFVDYYGARVLSEPPRTGINWLVYVVPPLAFFAGVYLLFRAFQTWKKMPKEPATGIDFLSSNRSESEHKNASSTPADDEYISRLENELKNRE